MIRLQTAALAFLAGTALLAACAGAPSQSAEQVIPAAGISLTIDFDTAMRGLNFNPATTDGNLDASGAGNGVPDADEMALVAAILSDDALNLSGTGGVRHADVAAAFAQAEASAASDFAKLLSRYPAAATVGAGYAMAGEGSLKAYSAMSSGFGAPMKGDYSLAIRLGRYLAHDGDADGDGVTNRAEYLANIERGRAAYLAAALDPKATLASDQVTAAPPKAGRKLVGVILYPGFEVLDVFGPVEMWANVPDFQVVMVSQDGRPVKSAQGVTVAADHSFAASPQFDILMVPGGAGTYSELNNQEMLGFIRRQDEKTQFTTSVCTGSALLAKAGVLKGREATSNKAFFSLARQQDLSVDWKTSARWVEDGKYFTSSGVSAGTDMSLGLLARIYGAERAAALARSLEYEWRNTPDDDPFALPGEPG